MEHAENKRFLRREVQEATTITSRKYKSSNTTASKNNNCCTTPPDNGSLKSSYGCLEKSEKEVLEARGIRIEDSDLKNFANLTPTEVANFYRGLGEWQDVLPKTDYSYSPMSDYYRKKINGRIPVIPNMSRRDIWKSDWNNTEIADNAINTYYAEQYESKKKRRWFSFSGQEKPSKVMRPSYQLPQLRYLKFISTTNTVRQWISEKFSRLSTPAPPYRRWWTSVETIRRNISWKRFSFSSSSVSCNATNTTTRTLFQYLFLIIFLILVYSMLSLSSSNSLIKPPSTIGSSMVESAFGFVYNVVDLTYTSISFIFSSISWPSEDTLNSVCNFVFTPLYKFGILLVSWWDGKPAATTGDRQPVDNIQLEELFRKFFDAGNSELVYKIINSPDFANFIDDKFKKLEEENSEKLEKLFNERSSDQNSIFEERINKLEALVAEWNVSEEIQRLREEVSSLREEIRSMEKQVEHDVVVLLTTVFQVEREGDQTNFSDLKNKFVAMFHSIEEAHRKIEILNVEFAKYASNASENIDIAMEYSKERIKFDLRSFIEELISRKMEELKTAIPSSTAADGNTLKHVEQLEKYIKEVVGKALEIYDADKTGLPDFALESSGGIILSTRCTETKTANAQFSILGIPLWQTSRSPRTVIQPGVHPGECWAFPGSTGFLVIQLSERILITGFTLEHIPRSLAPNGTIDSAPKDFSVWALRHETDPEPKLLGTFRFKADGSSLQYYEAIRLNEPYQIVELKILSNHGKIDYTCLYRFRIHGVPV